jgi:hypothetical protein
MWAQSLLIIGTFTNIISSLDCDHYGPYPTGRCIAGYEVNCIQNNETLDWDLEFTLYDDPDCEGNITLETTFPCLNDTGGCTCGLGECNEDDIMMVEVYEPLYELSNVSNLTNETIANSTNFFNSTDFINSTGFINATDFINSTAFINSTDFLNSTNFTSTEFVVEVEIECGNITAEYPIIKEACLASGEWLDPAAGVESVQLVCDELEQQILYYAWDNDDCHGRPINNEPELYMQFGTVDQPCVELLCDFNISLFNQTTFNETVYNETVFNETATDLISTLSQIVN